MVNNHNQHFKLMCKMICNKVNKIKLLLLAFHIFYAKLIENIAATHVDQSTQKSIYFKFNRKLRRIVEDEYLFLSNALLWPSYMSHFTLNLLVSF